MASVLFVACVTAAALSSETVAVRHAEGLVRGFLALRSLDGAVLATGDLEQTSQGSRVSSRLVFHFRNGSVQDETTVFTQNGRFRLLSDHLIQKGPSFPHPLEVAIDRPSGRVTVHDLQGGRREKVADERMELPEDLANGMVFALLKNIPPSAAATTVSMLVATPKPRLVHLVITRAGEKAFAVETASYMAALFRVKVEIGGLAGLVAPLLGKQPPDTIVSILEGDAPGFVRSDGPLYAGGPIWRIELASPTPAPAQP